MKKIITFLIIAFILSCEKNNEKIDYRDPFIGTFNFKTAYSITSMCQDSMLDCINHWRTWNFDTSNYLSKIEKVDTNRLLMKLTENTIDGYNDTIVLSLNGEITCPTFPIGGHFSFNGKYLSIDSIELNIIVGGLIGGYQSYKINGFRIK
jgi:hypothetical protein